MRKHFIIIILILYFGTIKSQDKAPSETGFIDALKTMSSNNTENLYTGMVSANIPLYTYKDNDFEIPLSLQYSSSGYKTYAPIGCVGLGWTLNAIGCITRKVNGIADEKDLVFDVPSSRGTTDPDIVTLFGNNNFNSVKPIDYKIENGRVLYDYWNGLFYYGANSKFIYGYIDTKPDLFTFNFLGHKGHFMLNEGDVPIFDTSKPEGEYQVEILSFGYQAPNYTVRIRITTGDGYKYIFEDNLALYSNGISFWHTYPLYSTHSTCFPLVEIDAPNGRKVTIEYYAKEVNKTVHGYFSRANDWTDSGNPSACSISNGYLTTAETVQPIHKITIGNTVINFQYTDRIKEKVDVPYLPSETGASLDVVRKLESISIVDNRLSTPLQTYTFNYIYGKDLGYTASRAVPLLKGIDASGFGKYNMDYYNEDKPFPTFLKGRDYWGYGNNSTAEDLLPGAASDLTTNTETAPDDDDSDGYGYTPDYKSTLQGMLKVLKYPTGGYSKYYYESHDYGNKLVKDLRNNNKNNSYLESVNNETSGGLRIKRITNYANVQDSAYTDYVYHKFGETTSTGILLHTPRFYREVNFKINGSAKRIRQVSWLNDFVSSEDGVNVAYSEVTKKYPDGSCCTYKFSDYQMFPDLPHDNSITFKKFDFTSPDLAYPDNFFATNDSRHRIRGKLLSKQYYNSSHNMTYSEDYDYDFNNFNAELSDEDMITYPYPLPAEYNVYSVNEAFSYFYIQKIYTRSCHLKSIIKSTYPSNGSATPIVENDNFSYNNAGQLVNKELTMSNGNKISSKTKYPYDLRSTNGGQNGYDKMFENGFRNYPVRTQTSILNKGITQASFSNYTNIGQGGKYLYRLQEIQNAEIVNPLSLVDFSPDIDNYLKIEKSFSYDSNGNIQEILYKDGTSTAYLMSYNYQYPIAEIRNATYQQISNELGSSYISVLAANPNPTNNDLSKVNALRSSTTLPNIQVTTYTYIPLKGASSKTDPRGVTTTYKYDDSGRLENSKDMNSNILQQYQYHNSSQK